MGPLVLVVEAHDGVRRLLTARFHREGLEVRSTNERELLRHIPSEQSRPAAIVADPFGTRTNTTVLLNVLSRLPARIPVFFFTSYVESAEAAERTAIAWFRKPIDSGSLCDTVSVTLKSMSADEPAYRSTFG
jgi:DNA-binding NtrC family response regulator